jgi:hypothetical protein
MANDQKNATLWGRPRDFVAFIICVTIIGIAAAARWRALDLAFAYAWLALCAMGSIFVLWRVWKGPAASGGHRLGQVAALPRSWQKWVLGEGNDQSKK